MEMNVDIAWDCPLGEFLDILEKSNGTLTNFIASGPGGGNPNVTISFQKQSDCNKFLDLYNGE